MSLSTPSPVLPPPDTAVLLVLLPLACFGETGPNAAHSTLFVRALQSRLGPGIRVLQVDEASHPAVVHSFGTPELPACVLVRQGVEIWRQHGLPEDEEVFTALLAAAHAH